MWELAIDLHYIQPKRILGTTRLQELEELMPSPPYFVSRDKRVKRIEPCTSGLVEEPLKQWQETDSAIVYCEANFGALDGKTANGLVRHSEKYDVLAVIDSTRAGEDAGYVLDEKLNGIPICYDLPDALAKVGSVPDYFIYGMAPASGMLSTRERGLLLQAIRVGMNIVNGSTSSSTTIRNSSTQAVRTTSPSSTSASPARRKTSGCSAVRSSTSAADGLPCSEPTARSVNAQLPRF